LKVFFHVGPHKTGTTAIQVYLTQNRGRLLESKVFFPKCPTGAIGNHKIPWSLLGWDLRMIGNDSRDIDLVAHLKKVMDDALLGECDTILLSSEDFSLLSPELWSQLLSSIQKVAPKNKKLEFKVGFFYRELDELVRSQYKTLVLLGLELKFEQVGEKLMSHFNNVYSILESLETKTSNQLETLGVGFQFKDSVKVFLSSFFPDLKIYDNEIDDMPLNASYSDELIESFRKLNCLDPVKFDTNQLLHWPKFHNLAYNLRLAERRRTMFPDNEARLVSPGQLIKERDALRSERDALRSERDALYGSRSWALTLPFRILANYARSLNAKNENQKN